MDKQPKLKSTQVATVPREGVTATDALIPTESKTVIGQMAARMNLDPKKLVTVLKKTVFNGCKTEEQFISACVVANTYKLNPITKEIYAFPNNGGVVPIVSVDGWVRIMNSHPQFDGIEFEEGGNIGDEKTIGNAFCTAVIYRKDRNHPVKVTEYLAECYRDTDPWNGMPRRMLRNKALIQCARVAFGFAGIYDADEGADILGKSKDYKGRRPTQIGEDGDVFLNEVPEGETVDVPDETPPEDAGGDAPEADGDKIF